MLRIRQLHPALYSLAPRRVAGIARAFSTVEEEENTPNGGGSGMLPVSQDTYRGISEAAFAQDAVSALSVAVEESNVQIKPDGVIYLPEIFYRRILNSAFGPGGWALMPVADHTVVDRVLYREYAMYCHGRFVSQAAGEMNVDFKTIPTALEGAKSNALMRCCKDLGIASELWDPTFIQQWRSAHAQQLWVENVKTREKRRFWRRNDQPFRWPWVETGSSSLGNDNDFSNSNDDSFSQEPSRPAQEQKSSESFQRGAAPMRNKWSPGSNDDGGDRAPSAAGAAQSRFSFEFDPDETVPPKFRRFAGRKWRDILREESTISYLEWVSDNLHGDMVVMAQAALDWYHRGQHDH